MPRLFVLLVLAGCAADHPPASESSARSATTRDVGATATGALDGSIDVVPDAAVDAGMPPPPPTEATTEPVRACLGDARHADAVSCPSSGACSESCARIAEHYRPGVAAFVAECISKLGACDEYGVIGCVDQAAARACPSADAEAYCAGFVTRCDPNAGGEGSAISQSGCVLYAAALTASGREAFRACAETAIVQGTCAKDVIACADEIRN